VTSRSEPGPGQRSVGYREAFALRDLAQRSLRLRRFSGSLNPRARILLHLLRLYEAEVSHGISKLDRLGRVASSQEAVDALGRLDGGGNSTREGIAIRGRLEGLAQPSEADGASSTPVAVHALSRENAR
jgi:hypothetical protein